MNETTGANTSGTNLFLRYPTRVDLLEEFAPVGQQLEKIVPPVWYAIGFIGNPISCIIWWGQRMRRNNSSAVYLGALAISDILFLFLNLLYLLHNTWAYNTYNKPISCEVFHIFYYMAQYMSTFLVFGFTLERYVAVCHPFLKERWCTVKQAIIGVVLLLILALCLAAPQGYIWTYYPGFKTCNPREEAAKGDEKSFWHIWSWTTDGFAFGFVPLLVLLFNVLVLKEIFKMSKNDVLKRQQSRRGGNNTASTVTLLSVSFYLIFTQVIATIVANLQNAFPPGNMTMTDEEIRNDPVWSDLFTFLTVRKIVEVLCLSHYACYFFIYCLTGKHFRKEVVFLVTLHGRFSFLASLFKRRRGERYSMVSTNGLPMSETYATSMSTTM